MERVILTDRKIKSLKPADTGKRYEVMDAVVSSFGVRVTDKGKRTFFLIGRFGGNNNPVRRALGDYGAITLEQARDKARTWISLNQKGTDPKIEEARAKQAELRKQRTSFSSVAEDYLARRVVRHRSKAATTREIRVELVARWAERPITEITRADVINLVEKIADRPAPYSAHLILGHIRALFNWAIARGTYGLEASPCDRLHPADIIPAKKHRQRVLTDPELAALWRATERIGYGLLGYPFGPLYQLLLLTGARKSEIAAARWGELDLNKNVLVIPPERFKSDATHLIPLSANARAIVDGLPRFSAGDYLFSNTLGKTPVANVSNAKDRLDALMAEELGGHIPPWVTHDIRRTVRTRLSELRVSHDTAEMIVGHAKKGLARVYDQHTYEPEMREALEQWAAKLRSIVTPPPPNVVPMRA